MKKTNLAVLLIDMQNHYLEDIKIEDKKNLIKNQKEVLEICMRKDIPVAVLEMCAKGKTAEELCLLIEKIPRKSFFEKRGRSGFYETPLYDELVKWSINSVFLMGIYATSCVLTTAEDALEKKLKIFTSGNVILDDFFPFDDYDNYEKNWYRKNGIFTEKYHKLYFLNEP